MSKMNYNRPFGGYDQTDHSWEWKLDAENKRNKKKKPALVKIKKTKEELVGPHIDHEATVRIMKYGTSKNSPVFWCLTCKKHIFNLNKDELKNYLEAGGKIPI